MKNKKNILILLLILTLTVVMSFSCSNKKKKAKKAVTPTVVTNQAKNDEILSEDIIGSAKEKRRDDDFLLKMTWGRQTPYDFKIGVLENLETQDYRTDKIIRRISEFYKSLGEGTVDKDLISPKSRIPLQSTMGYFITENVIPDYYRIGKLKPEANGIVRINMRFYLEDGVTEGEMIFEEGVVNGMKDWQVSDVQADFIQLKTKYEGPKEAFNPANYNFYEWE